MTCCAKTIKEIAGHDSGVTLNKYDFTEKGIIPFFPPKREQGTAAQIH